MKRKSKGLFSNFKDINWKAIILFTIAFFNIGLIVIWEMDSASPIKHGGDYLAFWSAGKIADEKGYSEIYSLENLKNVQTQALNKLGFLQKSILPAPYFSVYLLPFQLLSRIDLQYSYWIWTLINLIVLIGYFVFFLQKMHPGNGIALTGMGLFTLMFISFPIFDNLANGQLNVLLLVCTGEFIRHALNKKPVLSGIWLGGLLLKPQLLILILPIILIMRYWKVLMGFALSSTVLVLSSLALSGIKGMVAYARLLTGWGETNSVTAPEAMINWRMVGVYLNTYLNTSLGWFITGLGIVLTVLAVFILLKRTPLYGSPEWVITMLGVYSATLAITWHAHYHMALVLIPFLIYASVYRLLPEKLVFSWAVSTPIVWFGVLLIGAFSLYLARINIFDYQGMVIAFSGFIANLAILGFVCKDRYFRSRTSVLLLFKYR